jgi:hypothetical protein
VHRPSIFLPFAFGLGLSLLLPVSFAAMRAVYRPLLENDLSKLSADQRRLRMDRLRRGIRVLTLVYLLMVWTIPVAVWIAV